MIYASIAFRARNEFAVVAFDKDHSLYGPYRVDGWSGDLLNGLKSDELLFAFCAFKKDSSTIDIQEHHERSNDPSGPKPECIGYLFAKDKVEADFDIQSMDRLLGSLAGKAMVRDYVKENFHSMWNVAKATGQHNMNDVAAELNVTFNEVESAIVG